jgi:adenosylcobinamide-GDP ribazoletransferase
LKTGAVLNQFLLAIQFLTRLPVGRWIAFRHEDLPRAAKFFPLVGAIIGTMDALVFLAGRQVFPANIAILAAMLAHVLITGALHEDGFADTADGLAGATRERALEIMRDSRIGTFGVLALWFSLTVKFFALQWLVTFDTPIWRAFVVAPLLARCGGVALLATCKNVRPDSQTSGPFASTVSTRELMFAIVYTMLLVAALLGNVALTIILAAALITECCRAFFQRRLGGITGDCLGATIHLIELTVYVFLAAAAKMIARHTLAV